MKYLLGLAAVAIAVAIPNLAAGAAQLDDPIQPVNLATVPLQNDATDEGVTGLCDAWLLEQEALHNDVHPNDCPVTQYSGGTVLTDPTDPNSPTFYRPECFIRDAQIEATYVGGYLAAVGFGTNACKDVVLTLGYSGCVQGKRVTGWKNESCHAAQNHNHKTIHAESDYICNYTSITDNKFRYQYFGWVTYYDGTTYVSPTKTSNGLRIANCNA